MEGESGSGNPTLEVGTTLPGTLLAESGGKPRGRVSIYGSVQQGALRAEAELGPEAELEASWRSRSLLLLPPPPPPPPRVSAVSCRLFGTAVVAAEMPLENLEEEGLPKNPDLRIAQLRFLLSLPEHRGDAAVRDELMAAVRDNSEARGSAESAA